MDSSQIESLADIFYRQLPTKKKQSTNGWIGIDCPACGDTRGRLAFMFTPTGGFIAKCWNGGCEYQIQPTGFEPNDEYGLNRRTRRLYELLGGDIRDIPYQYLLKRNRSHGVNKNGTQEAVYDFPEVELPEGWDLLEDCKGKHPDEVRRYIEERGDYLMDLHPFVWSPKYPRYLIIPFCHFGGKIVGWSGRRIDTGKNRAHIRCPNWPKNYMLNQYLVNSQKSKRILVVEGEIDAITLKGLCSFGAKLSKKQIAFLQMTGKDIVLLPDQQKNEWSSYLQTARENNWYISVPQWPGVDGNRHIKDVGESIKVNGFLYTVETIMDGITNNYFKAETALRLRTNNER